MNDTDGIQAIRALAGSMLDLQRQAAQQYQPVVDDILRTRSRDTEHIEITCSISAAMNSCCRCTRSSVVTIGTSTPPPPLTTSMPTANIGTVTNKESSHERNARQGIKCLCPRYP